MSSPDRSWATSEWVLCRVEWCDKAWSFEPGCADAAQQQRRDHEWEAHRLVVD